MIELSNCMPISTQRKTEKICTQGLCNPYTPPIPKPRSHTSVSRHSHNPPPAETTNPFRTLDPDQLKTALEKVARTRPSPTPKPRNSLLQPIPEEDESESDFAVAETDKEIAVTPGSDAEKHFQDFKSIAPASNHEKSSLDEDSDSDSNSSDTEEMNIPSLDSIIKEIKLKVLDEDAKRINIKPMLKPLTFSIYQKPKIHSADSVKSVMFKKQKLPDFGIGTWNPDFEKIRTQDGSIAMIRPLRKSRRSSKVKGSNFIREISKKNEQLDKEWKMRQTKMMERSCENQLKLTLAGCGLEKYESNFRKHQIPYLDFLRLTSRELKDIGIADFDDRIMLLKKITEISSGAFSEDGKPCPPRLRQHLPASEILVILDDLVGHVRRVAGVRTDEENNGITKIHQFIREGRLVIEVPTVEHPDPVEKIIKASDGLLQECKKFDEGIGNLKQKIAKKECNGIKSIQNTQAQTQGKKMTLAVDKANKKNHCSWTYRQFVFGSIILGVGIGTASFFVLKKLMRG